MFLVDRRKKMVRKIAILLPMFFLCLGLDNCKSPEGQSMLKHIYEYQYRYNVAVIYKRGEGDYQKTRDYDVLLTYWLYDPAKTKPPNYWPDYGTIEMNKIGENEYRCYLPKVFIQTPLLSHNKHLSLSQSDVKELT
jgi:hypothetical protein